MISDVFGASPGFHRLRAFIRGLKGKTAKEAEEALENDLDEAELDWTESIEERITTILANRQYSWTESRSDSPLFISDPEEFSCVYWD